MDLTSGDLLTTADLINQADADAESVRTTRPEVVQAYRSGLIPVQVMNAVMMSSDDESGLPTADTAWFGTHVREAAKIIRDAIRK